jgi:hypothetical protein
MKYVLGSIVFLLVAPGLAKADDDTAPHKPAVREIQAQLEALGFTPGPIDGIRGPLTDGALVAFQKAEHLRATGILDDVTVQKLGEIADALSAGRDRRPVFDREVVAEEDDEAAVSELFGAASVETERVRLAAVAVLGEMRTARSRATLGIVLHANSLASVRIAAAHQLGLIGDAPSLLALAMARPSEADPKVVAAIDHELESSLPVEMPPRPIASR